MTAQTHDLSESDGEGPPRPDRAVRASPERRRRRSWRHHGCALRGAPCPRRPAHARRKPSAHAAADGAGQRSLSTPRARSRGDQRSSSFLRARRDGDEKGPVRPRAPEVRRQARRPDGPRDAGSGARSGAGGRRRSGAGRSADGVLEAGSTRRAGRGAALLRRPHRQRSQQDSGRARLSHPPRLDFRTVLAEDPSRAGGHRMTAGDFARVRSLFDQAMDLPPNDRRAFLDREVPPGDPRRSELVAMVEAGDDSTFLADAFANGVLDQARPADNELPSQIGHYKILRRLGKGGMGVVFLALRNDDVFHKVVALKVIGDVADAPGINLVQRFKQERQILAGLDHPNIARILDGGNTEDGRPFYVMEYVAGSPIDEYCTRMNTDVPTRVRMMAQVCDAVDYLHANAIAHRDIKPHNILVTLDGRVKLVDFGIAKVETVRGLLRSAPSGAEPTMIMTPGYASPEQIAGDASGKSGDIYSVAVVLYQLLTGRLPHAGQDGRPDLDARVSGRPPEPPSKEFTKTSRQVTGLPDPGKVSFPDLDRVVLTALQRDPLQRYGTVQLFGEDLRRCLDGRPIAARPASITYTMRKMVSRNPVVAAVAAIAILVAGGGAWLAVGARFERVELQAKEEELERFVNLLAAKVAGWQAPDRAVPVNERVADVRA